MRLHMGWDEPKAVGETSPGKRVLFPEAVIYVSALLLAGTGRSSRVPGTGSTAGTVIAGDPTGLALPGPGWLQRCSEFVFSMAEGKDDLSAVRGARRSAAGPGLRGLCQGCPKPDRELNCCDGREVTAEHLPRLRLRWGFEPAGGLVGGGIRGLQGREQSPPAPPTPRLAQAGAPVLLWFYPIFVGWYLCRSPARPRKLSTTGGGRKRGR